MHIQQIVPFNLACKPQTLRLQKAGLIIFAGVLMLNLIDDVHAADKSKTIAQENTVELSEMEVNAATERSDSLLGIADSASQGHVGQEQLKYRPITRPSEVLETVPGMISSQHSGEGKASQYYLRGFNLDHGTDFLTEVGGAPVNQPSHAHGQGWMDTNFLIPEMIKTIDYKKGNYYAENGNFSSTGSANIEYFNELPNTTVKFTGGSFDYFRGLAMGSTKIGDGNLAYAGETVHNNGPWNVPNDYMKYNGVLSYSEGDKNRGWSLTGMAYQSSWNSTDQIPQRAVRDGSLNRFGTIDPTDGGISHRYSVTGEWHKQDGNSATSLMAYGIYSRLKLFSNFTYFMDNPVLGDQFGQPDQRYTFGVKAKHTIYHKIGSADSESTFGFQSRNDSIHNGLILTSQRQTYDTVRRDDIMESNIAAYFNNKTHWNDWFRSELGVRLDGFRFNVHNSNQIDNNGTRYDGMVSPKLGLTFGPWANTEFYLNGGLGYHSNDSRGINTVVDPRTGLNTDSNGDAIKRAVPLARTYGAEIGARTTWVEGLQSTLAIWWLDIASELIFVGDAGTTEASHPSRRVGIEWANFYSPTDWLTFDADLSFSKARFRDNPVEGKYIPGSVNTVLATGATFHDVWGGFFGGPRLRYFGPRVLIEDGTQRSRPTIMLSGTLGYQFNKNWSVQAEVFNLMNRKDSGIDYYYESQLQNEASPVGDTHFHPVEPISFRLSVTANF